MYEIIDDNTYGQPVPNKHPSAVVDELKGVVAHAEGHRVKATKAYGLFNKIRTIFSFTRAEPTQHHEAVETIFDTWVNNNGTPATYLELLLEDETVAPMIVAGLLGLARIYHVDINTQMAQETIYQDRLHLGEKIERKIAGLYAYIDRRFPNLYLKESVHGSPVDWDLEKLQDHIRSSQLLAALADDTTREAGFDHAMKKIVEAKDMYNRKWRALDEKRKNAPEPYSSEDEAAYKKEVAGLTSGMAVITLRVAEIRKDLGDFEQALQTQKYAANNPTRLRDIAEKSFAAALDEKTKGTVSQRFSLAFESAKAFLIGK